MKKIISSILCISLLASIICVPVSATAKNTEDADINDFIKGITSLTQKYDAEKDFEVASENISSENFSEDAPTYYSASSVSENETDDVPGLNFQTCRLIVQSNNSINTYNAVDVVSGFSNFYILQYANESDTEKAYKNYKENKSILSVTLDTVRSIESNYILGREDDVIYTKHDYENDWSLNATGLDKVLEKTKTSSLRNITVAIVDTGVEYTHEALKGRIARTYFNSSGVGSKNDEMDLHGHGTAISSVIARATPENISIAVYKVGTSEGIVSLTATAAGLLKAISDNIKFINCSFLFSDDDLAKHILEYAKSKNCIIFKSAGNYSQNTDIRNTNYFHNNNSTFIVGSSNIKGYPSSFSEYGSNTGIMAPGEDICMAFINNSYTVGSGTSFSCPLVLAIYAFFISTNPLISDVDSLRKLACCTTKITEPYTTEYFGNGIVDALDLFDLDVISTPQFNVEEGVHIGELKIELAADSGSDIYYTFDQTFPSPSNGFLYKEPITLNGEFYEITAVAYKNNERSKFARSIFFSAYIGTNDMFTIDDTGRISSFKGSVEVLKIPEEINGITVTDIAENVFTDATVSAVYLPDTMKILGDDSVMGGNIKHESCFVNGNNIMYVWGNNIKTIGYGAFKNCTNLREVCFPKCEYILGEAFSMSGLIGAVFPEVKELFSHAFYNSLTLREIYLPKCEFFFDFAFYNCRSLRILFAPLIDLQTHPVQYPDVSINISQEGMYEAFVNTYNLSVLSLPKVKVLGFTKNFISDSFKGTTVNRLELSNIEYLYELPTPGSRYSSYYLPVTVDLVLPSTLKYCEPTTNFINEQERSYVVYGTEGTYAQDWAKANNVPFYPISQSTAIVEDVDPIWDKYSYKPLMFDARGFNRTYQWYGSFDNKISDNDIAINGATTNEFDPGESNKYAYYYCKMLSVDGDSKVEITSSMCQNRYYYMYAKDKTEIDFNNKLIYTTQFVCRYFLEIVQVNENTSYLVTPSYAYQNNCWYGTGSQLQIQDINTSSEITYTLIVEGDINGDSVVDVLDVSGVEQVSNSHRELTGNYYLAGDSNRDGVIDVVDYQSVVNRAL